MKRTQTRSGGWVWKVRAGKQGLFKVLRPPLMVSLSNHRQPSFDRLRTSGWLISTTFKRPWTESGGNCRDGMIAGNDGEAACSSDGLRMGGGTDFHPLPNPLPSREWGQFTRTHLNNPSLRGAQPLMVSLSNHVAISMRLNTRRRTAVATATRLPTPASSTGSQ